MGRCAVGFVVAAIALACGNGATAQDGTPRLFGQHTPASEDQLLEELSQSPDNAGARLALARLYFRESRDAAADFAARQALADAAAAGQTDIVAQARDLLGALQRRRRWVFTADATIAPDTSREFLISGETEDDPSTLLERDSGLGIEGFASLERRIPIGDDTLLSLQGFGRGEAFEEDDFNTLD
ncbi:MAG: hypothetical protein AAFY10_07395, partial [Pseudomonadota bacterium]